MYMIITIKYYNKNENCLIKSKNTEYNFFCKKKMICTRHNVFFSEMVFPQNRAVTTGVKMV